MELRAFKKTIALFGLYIYIYIYVDTGLTVLAPKATYTHLLMLFKTDSKNLHRVVQLMMLLVPSLFGQGESIYR